MPALFYEPATAHTTIKQHLTFEEMVLMSTNSETQEDIVRQLVARELQQQGFQVLVKIDGSPAQAAVARFLEVGSGIVIALLLRCSSFRSKTETGPPLTSSPVPAATLPLKKRLQHFQWTACLHSRPQSKVWRSHFSQCRTAAHKEESIESSQSHQKRNRPMKVSWRIG